MKNFLNKIKKELEQIKKQYEEERKIFQVKVDKKDKQTNLNQLDNLKEQEQEQQLQTHIQVSPKL